MRPFEGIRVLDLSRVLAGPTTTAILGDLGCEIIKVENPDGGDETRLWGPPWVGSESAYYLSANRNKRSIAINIKTQKGKQIIEKILATSDILIMNFTLKTMEKLGLTYAWAKSVKKDIIFVNISGFGLTGPKKNLPGYDILIQGMSGLMSITGEENGPPVKVGVAIADVITALYTVIAVEAALYRREKTDEGTLIDNSLYESMTSALVNVASNYLVGGLIPKRYGSAHPNIVPYQAFKAKDMYIIIGIGNNRQFLDFTKILGHEEWANDERFNTNAQRVKNRNILIPMIEKIIQTKNGSDWIKLLREKNIPVAPINTMDKTFSDEQIIQRGLVQTIEHPLRKGLKIMKNPIHFNNMETSIYRYPPLLGEHTIEILQEYGYTIDEINELQENGIIKGSI